MSDYIKDSDVAAIANDLIEKYPELFSHIEQDRLLYVREISRSQKSRPGTCAPVKPPYNLLNPDILYIIVVYYKAGWDALSDAQRAALVMHQLLHISKEFDGSVLPHDIDDWSFLVDTLGSNYLTNSKVPNLRQRESNLVENLDSLLEGEENTDAAGDATPDQ